MSRRCSIIMYHYVRELKHSRFPEIKGLPLDLFKEQLLYIQKHYNVIRMKDLVEAVESNEELPDRSLLLTFDDAYKDHFDFVFPILDEMGIEGSFFPPAKAILKHEVLDVNKIHFVLASVGDKQQIIDDIHSSLDEFRREYSLRTNAYYFNKPAGDNRFDSREVIFIKRILQKELPEKLRHIIVDRLFCKYVTADEGSFSRELYMSVDQLKCLRRHGMYIGSHGFDHYWLNTLPENEQQKEIELSIDFLKSIDCDVSRWVMCYSYGAHNDSLISFLELKGCKLGLTTQVEIADLNRDNAFALPRLDTNDLPKDRNSNANEWTLKAQVVTSP